MEDFFKNLRSDPVLNIEQVSNTLPTKMEATEIVEEQKQEEAPSTIDVSEKLIDSVVNLGSGGINIADLSDQGISSLEDARITTTLQKIESDGDIYVLYKEEDGMRKLLGESEPVTVLDVAEINRKLDEISEHSKAALEDLRSQSTKIVDTASVQSSMVLDNAKATFNVLTKSIELEQQKVGLPSTAEEPAPSAIDDATASFEENEKPEDVSITAYIMDFLN